MDTRDDDLMRFEAEGPPALPTEVAGHIENDGAHIWYARYGAGPAVVLLHGGLGNAGNWGFQVPALVAAGYQVIVIDSRGHGRSTRDDQPYSYELMGSDVLTVLDEVRVQRAAIVGWSDGACVGLILARQVPERISGVLFFACNMDPSGTLPFVLTPVIERCFSRHQKDYAALSATPGAFQRFVDAVSLMQQTQPNYSTADLAEITVPVTVALGEGDEFIKPEHADYLARSIAKARRVTLPGVTHFAPVQRPAVFNEAVLEFLAALPA
ncbi:alpha/beta fold hydrolase [Devosia sp.]|uniref:alpha/beta fold hydrolase n=1 Tax=Devosia sp. TaxID=1871048 RepID=UPI003BA89E3C